MAKEGSSSCAVGELRSCVAHVCGHLRDKWSKMLRNLKDLIGEQISSVSMEHMTCIHLHIHTI